MPITQVGTMIVSLDISDLEHPKLVRPIIELEKENEKSRTEKAAVILSEEPVRQNTNSSSDSHGDTIVGDAAGDDSFPHSDHGSGIGEEDMQVHALEPVWTP